MGTFRRSINTTTWLLDILGDCVLWEKWNEFESIDEFFAHCDVKDTNEHDGDSCEQVSQGIRVVVSVGTRHSNVTVNLGTKVQHKNNHGNDSEAKVCTHKESVIDEEHDECESDV